MKITFPIRLTWVSLAIIMITACDDTLFEDEDNTSARKKVTCTAPFSFRITSNLRYEENLILFSNGRLDTGYHATFSNDFINTTVRGTCGDTVKIFRGRVFNTINTSFNNLFDAYQINTTTSGKIKTKQDDLCFGVRGWHIMKMDIEQTGAAEIRIKLNEFTYTFIPQIGRRSYTFLVSFETPYYKNIEIEAVSRSGAVITTKVHNFRLTGYWLFEMIKQINGI